MSGTVTITLDALHSAEAATLRRTIDTVLRNVEIRARYRELRGRGTSAAEAKLALSDTYSLAPDTIHNILWPR